jgi:hypothetical protein
MDAAVMEPLVRTVGSPQAARPRTLMAVPGEPFVALKLRRVAGGELVGAQAFSFLLSYGPETDWTEAEKRARSIASGVDRL